MEVQALGVSASPVPGSNTDWAVKKILKHTGLDWQFVKLSELNIHTCNGCIGCSQGNHCIVRDDAQELAGVFSRVRAIVLGGYTPLGSLDARAKIFMERMACMRGQHPPVAGRVAVSVIATARPAEGLDLTLGADLAVRQVDAWMGEEGLVNLGTMVILGNVPNLRAGRGDDCAMSAVRLVSGPYAPGSPLHIAHAENEARFETAARELADKLRQAVLDMGEVATEHREAV